MLTPKYLEDVLKKVVPTEFHSVIPSLVELLVSKQTNTSSTNGIAGSQQSDSLTSVLHLLAGRELHFPKNNATLLFGQDNQIGDIQIRDIAGQDVFNITIYNQTSQDSAVVSPRSPNKKEEGRASKQRLVIRRELADVVIAHDDLSFAEMIADIVRDEGYLVSLAQNIQGAESLIERYQPKSLITDVYYVQNGGFSNELANKYRLLCPGLRIIGIGVRNIVGVKEVFDEVITKPFTVEALVTALAYQE